MVTWVSVDDRRRKTDCRKMIFVCTTIVWSAARGGGMRRSTLRGVVTFGKGHRPSPDDRIDPSARTAGWWYTQHTHAGYTVVNAVVILATTRTQEGEFPA